jgi:DNA-directed RNA polymerase specialized sigma subunit
MKYSSPKKSDSSKSTSSKPTPAKALKTTTSNPIQKSTTKQSRKTKVVTPARVTVNPVSKYKDNRSYGDALAYLGQPEWHFWNEAQLESKDIIYINIDSEFTVEELTAAFPEVNIKITVDGKLAISAYSGNLDKDALVSWLNDNNLFYNGIRAANNVKSRDISKLDKRFLDVITRKGTEFAISQIYSKHKSYVSMLIVDEREIPGVAAEIVLGLIEKFDANKGVPFLAYVSTRLGHKLQDIGRSQIGRVSTDFAIAYNRAITKTPEMRYDESLLSEAMGVDVERLRKRLSDLHDKRSIQSPISIYQPLQGGAEGEMTLIQMPHDSEYSLEEQLLESESISRLYIAINKVAVKYDIILPKELNKILEASVDNNEKQVNKNSKKILTGMKSTYLRMWEEQNTTEISKILGVTSAYIRDSEKRYYLALRKEIDNNK